jgi:hypothetical protein
MVDLILSRTVWPIGLLVAGVLVEASLLGVGIDDLDEGYFLQQGWRVLRGQVPYRDFETLYTPGLAYLHAGIIALQGGALALLGGTPATVAAWLASLPFGELHASLAGWLASPLFGAVHASLAAWLASSLFGAVQASLAACLASSAFGAVKASLAALAGSAELGSATSALAAWLGSPVVGPRLLALIARAALVLLLFAMARPLVRSPWWAVVPGVVLLLGLDDAPERWEPHPGWLSSLLAVLAIWCLTRVRPACGRLHPPPSTLEYEGGPVTGSVKSDVAPGVTPRSGSVTQRTSAALRRAIWRTERHTSPAERHTSPTECHISPTERRTPPPEPHISPTERHTPPPEPHISPTERHTSLAERHISPTERHTSPSEPHISPAERHISPAERHVSPAERHTSPAEPRISSAERHTPPTEGHISPAERHTSPAEPRISSAERHTAPAEPHVSPAERHYWSPAERHTSLWLFASGLAAAGAYLFKQNTGVFMLGAIVVWCFWSGWPWYLPLLAFGLTTLVWLIPMALTLNGNLQPMGVIVGAVSQAGLLSPPEPTLLIPFMAIVGGLWLLRRVSHPHLRLYLWAGLALLLIEFPRMDTLHLIWATPLLLVVGAVALERLPPAIALASLAAAAVLLWPTLSSRLSYVSLPRTSIEGVSAPTQTANDLQPTLEDIREHTQPGEPIFVYPSSPLVYVLADRPNATRFDHLNPGAASPEQIQQVIADLERADVRLVVISDFWQAAWGEPGANAVLEDWINAHFSEVARHGTYRVLVADL